MTHSYSRCCVHIVFATKHRQPTLTDDIRPAAFRYMVGAIRRTGCSVLALNGVSDHVHILLHLDRQCALARVIRDVKGASARWLKQQGPAFVDFQWQAGYAAFSVSHDRIGAVCRYIERQEAHHAMTTFDVEYMRILRLQGVEFKEEGLWS